MAASRHQYESPHWVVGQLIVMIRLSAAPQLSVYIGRRRRRRRNRLRIRRRDEGEEEEESGYTFVI